MDTNQPMGTCDAPYSFNHPFVRGIEHRTTRLCQHWIQVSQPSAPAAQPPANKWHDDTFRQLRVEVANAPVAQPSNPFEPEETEQAQNRRIGRMIRGNANKRANAPAAETAQPENSRCAVCGWPLVEGDGINPLGCVRGNCSMRPRPDRLYDSERAIKEAAPPAPEGQQDERFTGRWIYEDELPKGYPYDDMFPHSRLGADGRGGCRIFPELKSSASESQPIAMGAPEGDGVRTLDLRLMLAHTAGMLKEFAMLEGVSKAAPSLAALCVTHAEVATELANKPMMASQPAVSGETRRPSAWDTWRIRCDERREANGP